MNANFVINEEFKQKMTFLNADCKNKSKKILKLRSITTKSVEVFT